MITATDLSDQKDLFARIRRYSVPSILAGATSDEIAFPAPPEGTIKGVALACLSAKLDLSLRQQAGIITPHIDEIYKVTDIEYTWRASGLAIVYRNRDTAPQEFLYGVFTNLDTNDSGVVTIELTIS